jgi:uncharacterized protein YlxW (UPF0749 family)
MFQDQGFLIIEMVTLLILAALLGLLVAWLIWGRHKEPHRETSAGSEKKAIQLEKALQDYQRKQAERDTRRAALQEDLEALNKVMRDTAR